VKTARAGKRLAAVRLVKTEHYLPTALEPADAMRTGGVESCYYCYRETPSSLRCPHMVYQHCNASVRKRLHGPVTAYLALRSLGPRRICHLAEDAAVHKNYIHLGMPRVP
jgi:hypothetical protein